MRVRTKIPVDEDLIEAGIKKDATYCIIAEAVRRALPEATGIRVDLATIRWSDPDKGVRYIYLTPLAAQQMIVDFDQGYGTDRLKPFMMRLKDFQAIPMRTAAAKRQASGVGKGNGEPKRRKVRIKSDGSAEIIGGRAMPVADARSPERQRRYGARQLRP